MISYPEDLDFKRRRVSAFKLLTLLAPFSPAPRFRSRLWWSEDGDLREGRKSGLLLFVFGDDAAAAMRTLPIALLEVGARVSDLFTTVLARHCDMFVFRHAARITESSLECILVMPNGKKDEVRGRLAD